jgi:hydrogenase expression/formation protein HypC
MCLGVIEIFRMGEMQMCKVDFGGVTREVCLAALPDAGVGEYVIVHAGFALNTLSEQDAQETLDLLNELEMVSQSMDDEEKVA